MAMMRPIPIKEVGNIGSRETEPALNSRRVGSGDTGCAFPCHDEADAARAM